MSKQVLVVCTGNTCRSPMAEALLRAIGTPAIVVESAGSEAADGMAPTEHAVQVMAERGLAIATHRSRSVESLDLRKFDFVLAMTPAIARDLVRLGVDPARIRQTAVEDPYCRGVAAYRRAADEIETALKALLPDLLEATDDPPDYLREAIRRLGGGEVQAGSHAAGIFGRCVADFESHVRSWFGRILSECSVDYDKDIRASCKGVALDKATLGQLIVGLERSVQLAQSCIGPRIPAATTGLGFLDGLRAINGDWVRMKHQGAELSIPLMLDRMTWMLAILKTIKA